MRPASPWRKSGQTACEDLGGLFILEILQVICCERRLAVYTGFEMQHMCCLGSSSQGSQAQCNAISRVLRIQVVERSSQAFQPQQEQNN